MGHAVDQNLFALVQREVQVLGKNYKKTEQEMLTLCESLDQVLKDWKEHCGEIKEISKRLESIEKSLQSEILIRVEEVEKRLFEEEDKKEQLKDGHARIDNEVKQLKVDLADSDDKILQLQDGLAKTDDKVEQLKGDLAESDNKMEQLQEGLAKTDDIIK